jgi:hypothetical protein
MYPSFFTLVLAAVLLFFSTVGIGTVVDWVAGQPHASLMVDFSGECSEGRATPDYLAVARHCPDCQ